MKFASPRMATFAGFFISFAAIVVNALILANINNRIGAVDAESARLNEALRVQTVNGNEAEAKFGNYRIMHHLASLVSSANRADAVEDATIGLNEALTFLFAAANEVSVTEIRRVESEAVDSEETQQLYEEAKKAEDSDQKTPTAEAPKAVEDKEIDKKLEQALRDLEEAYAPKDENLRKKIDAIRIISIAAAASENPNELFVRLYPVNKSLSARWVESVKQKQARLVELGADKSRLITYQGYSTFAALSLQMLGLMFVIFKDFLEKRESKDDSKE